MSGNPKKEKKDRLVRRAEVEERTGLSRNAIYTKMRAGQFPEPYRVGPMAVRWSEREIEAWVPSRPRSHGDGTHRVRNREDDATG